MAINKKCAIGAAILAPVIILIAIAFVVALTRAIAYLPPLPEIVGQVASCLIIGCLFIWLICVIWKALYDHCVNWNFKRKINKIKEKP